MQTQNSKTSFFSAIGFNFSFWALLLLVGVVLYLPEYYAFSRLGAGVNHIWLTLGAFSLAGLVTLPAYWLGRRSWLLGVGWFVALLSVLLAVRCAHALLVDFTGRGFTDEVFFHLEPESFRVGWREYGALLSRIVGLGLLGAVVCGLLLAKAVRRRMGALWLLGIMCAGLFYATRSVSSEYLLLAAYGSYVERSRPIEVDASVLARFAALGVLSPVAKPKSALLVEASARPRNLILVYLESFNVGLLDNPRYPDLTPNLNRLKNEYGLARNYYTSGYVTIEGIIDSQCGTLVDMSRQNDSFMGDQSRMVELPCLGDVLKQAGYRQMYLGGAAMEFAGKGNFLADHGFDDIRGWEYWNRRGLKQPPGAWGLSDAELFDQALAALDELRAAPPYNLTLLTIGTHLPGYSYEGCEPYAGAEGGDRFLDAIHCTDKLLGGFVERLRTGGYLDPDTVLVITADHGVFPTPKMRELFGGMVEDRRLVTIVAGADFPYEVPMAAYDLAPSILDLLGIRHDASFIFGTSVFADDHRQQQFFTRYGEFVAGEFTASNPDVCVELDPNFVPTLPLDHCGKRLLMSSIAAYQRQFVARATNGAGLCGGELPSTVLIPADAAQPLQISLQGRAQERDYSSKGWLVKPDRQGAYLLVANGAGLVFDRHFYDVKLPEEQQALLQYAKTLEDGLFVSLVLRLADDTVLLPELLEWLAKITDQVIEGPLGDEVVMGFTPLGPARLIAREAVPGLALELDNETCQRLAGAGQ